MRLFVAVDIPESTQAAIAALIARLKPGAPWLKWGSASNLHLTLRFIGESDDSTRIGDTLSQIHMAPIGISLRGLGSFPRVLWIGVQAPELAPLARQIEQALAPLGIPAESRPFSAHLTLARLKDGRMPRFDEQPDFGTFTASEFVLYESKLASSGPAYTALRRFPLC